MTSNWKWKFLPTTQLYRNGYDILQKLKNLMLIITMIRIFKEKECIGSQGFFENN